MDIVELFAGVGGFRVGFENANKKFGEDFYNVIWANQWEPATKTQNAYNTYCRVYGNKDISNVDINKVEAKDIPNHDLLCGGFPCQDYSVARTLDKSGGIEGKKGVLWWEIIRIIKEKNTPILFLENVDRLLVSPAKQRGRDFAMILNSLDELGYIVEWRVINAAEYGMPQRRKRTYILAYKKNSEYCPVINHKNVIQWIEKDGVFAKAFPITIDIYNKCDLSCFDLKDNSSWDMADLSANFNKENKVTPFCNCGVMIDGVVYTIKATPDYHGPYITLGDVLAKGEERNLITEDFYIKDDVLPRWKYMKGGKREKRVSKDGYEFTYSEGAMAFPDSLDKPSRTIITAEGGSAPSRFKHVIKDPVNGRYRRLIPLELERLDMFPDNHTIGESDTKRAFFMGNALVCGVIEKVAEELKEMIDENIKDLVMEGADEEARYFVSPSYVSAIIGTDWDGRIIYSYEKMIEYLIDNCEMTYEDALDFIDVNTLAALPGMGEKRPIILFELNENI